jgi:putative lipoprotein
MKTALCCAAAAIAFLACGFGCERAPDSTPTTQSASDKLREAARSLKEEAKETARVVKEEAKAVGDQVRQAAHEVKEHAKESAVAMKDQAVSAWATTREEALTFSATALDKTRETLAALREKAAQASEATRPLIEKAIGELDAQSRVVGEQYEKLKESAPEQWEKVSEGFGPQLEKLKSAAEEAARQFNVTPAAAITGTVTYRERMAIPAGAELTVRLLDFSRDPAAPTVIAEKTAAVSGQPPVKFELPYDASKLDPSATYKLDARIKLSGRTLFRTAEAATAISQGKPATLELVLKHGGG